MRILELTRRQLLVAHVSSIPVRIDYRWFAVWAFMSWLTAINIPDVMIENDVAKFAIGAFTILIFFFTVFLHEFAHAFVARTEGIEVLEIILHPFGGLARLKREPNTPRAEFRIAIAGPGASFIVAVVFFGLWALSSTDEATILSPIFFLLFLLNLLLAIFNLFPGYPLDGGRVLRAFLWHRGTDLTEATLTTGKFGQIIGVALIFFGIAIVFINSDFFTGLWTVVVGLFLYDAAAGIIKKIRNFEDLIAADVMELAVPVDPDLSVMEFVETFLPLHRRVVFPVARDRQLYGFLVLKEMKEKLPRDQWWSTKARQAMRPIREDLFVEIGTPVADAKALMRTNGLGAVGVVDAEGRLVGLIERGRIRRRS